MFLCLASGIWTMNAPSSTGTATSRGDSRGGVLWEGGWPGLILMFEKVLEVTITVLACDIEASKQWTIILQCCNLMVYFREIFLIEKQWLLVFLERVWDGLLLFFKSFLNNECVLLLSEHICIFTDALEYCSMLSLVSKGIKSPLSSKKGFPRSWMVSIRFPTSCLKETCTMTFRMMLWSRSLREAFRLLDHAWHLRSSEHPAPQGCSIFS